MSSPQIALAGLGVVGGAVASRLVSDRDPTSGSGGVLRRVLVRRSGRPRPIDDELLTTDLAEFLATPAPVVIEVIGGLEPAGTIARHVLSRGGVLITANKELVARHGPSLCALAEASGGWFGFDAAVGGGVPIVRTIRSALAGHPVSAIRGILNGTANFVLTALESGAALTEAVAEAQRRGLAEAEWRRDLDGRDVAAKLAILSWVTWGVAPAEVAVHRQGLLPDPEALVHEARRLGGCLRLIGECRRTPDGVVARVRPEVVDPDSAFGRAQHEENLVHLDLGWSAPLALSGPGAGGAPTATAVLADLVAAADHRQAGVG